MDQETYYDVEYAGHSVTDCRYCPYLDECRAKTEGKAKKAEHYDNGECPLEQ